MQGLYIPVDRNKTPTCRPKQHFSPTYVTPQASCRGDDVYSEKVGNVLCLKWKDKRDVLLLSTIHDDVAMVDILRRSRTVAGGVERIKKPKVIDDYNQHMGGVDQSDQLVMYYGSFMGGSQ